MKDAHTSPFSKFEAEESRPAHAVPLIAAGLSLAIIVWFYGFVPRFGSDGSLPLFGWLMRAWHGETGFEFILFPAIIMGLIGYRFKHLCDAAKSDRVSYPGLIAVFCGALIYVVSYRLFLPRTAAVGLPILWWGVCHFLWGWRTAKILFFPLFIFWLAIPLPSFQHITLPMKLWVLALAHHCSSFCGVETTVMGTMIFPVAGDCPPIELGWGCSNQFYALIPLLMISVGWAYVAKIKMWQKAVFFLSAIPIAIIGNALRLTSILVIAENGDARWAATTSYDWSGVLLVYPLSFFLLLVLHSLFLGRLPWKKAPQVDFQDPVPSRRDAEADSA